METEIKKAERMRISAFADLHGLRMEIVERSPHWYAGGGNFEDNRWYAHFKDVEISEDNRFLVGAHGNGRTPAQAVAEYARRISGQKLIHKAYTAERKEIYAPIVTR